MKTVIIDRTEGGDDGVFGTLTAPAECGFSCYTAELPWRNNAKGFSCIPDGDYICEWTKSPSRKNPDGSPEWTYRLKGVKGREGVLIHSGNFAGDKTRGYVSDVEGCILLGRAIMDIEIPPKKRTSDRVLQKGVSSSRDTVAAFAAAMDTEPFLLAVTSRPGVIPQ